MFRSTRTNRLFSGIALAGCLITAFGFYRHVRQVRLDHKLIRALRHLDSASALDALAEGADANARELPETSLSFFQILKNAFVHHPQAPATNAASALLVATDFRWRELDWSGYHAHIDMGYVPGNAPAQDPRVIASLLEHGADVNAKNEIGLDPLHIAAWAGKSETVRLLLEHGANVNALSDARYARREMRVTPLLLAIPNGDLATIRLLVKHGADIDTIRDEEGDTGLSLAQALAAGDRTGLKAYPASNADMKAYWLAEVRRDDAIVAILEAALKKSKKMSDSSASLSQGAGKAIMK